MSDVRVALSRHLVDETAAAIAARQRPDGRLPWHTGQHTDAWNHVEGAMGLLLGGMRCEAEHAYEWLARAQRPDGSWAQSYAWDGTIEDPDVDTNMCAYVATGVWHHFLLTSDRGFLDAMWPVVERAIDYVLDHQAATGEIAWMHHADGTIDRRALLTASSSIYMSVRCAVAIAEEIGHERPDWELSIGLLAHALRARQDAFWPKPRWSMDWYYPVMTGALRGQAAGERLDARWETFVMPGRGCRCVADKPWVTTAETCELILALHATAVRPRPGACSTTCSSCATPTAPTRKAGSRPRTCTGRDGRRRGRPVRCSSRPTHSTSARRHATSSGARTSPPGSETM
jgi:hypothetical protein